jgi:hypothetical protein
MLLTALDPIQNTSTYFHRAPEAAAIFLYGVGIMSIVIFVFAVIASMRVSPEAPKD